MSSPASSFQDVLDYLRDRAINSREQGELFERIIKSYLKTDNIYRDRFSKVHLWRDWQGRNRMADFGADLVAEGPEGLCAIQCKFYASDIAITKKQLDSFLEASSRNQFSSSILVYTGAPYGRNVEEALKGHNCQVLDSDSLESAHVNWPDIQSGTFDVSRKEPYTLRKHQKIALENVYCGLVNDGDSRGKMIMACGTGKTLTAMHIAEKIAGRGKTVLYLVPSISLLRQTLQHWSEQRLIPHRYIGVCSDSEAGKNNDDLSVEGLQIGVTVDETAISKQLKRSVVAANPDKMTVVFSTYQSLKAVASAQKKAKLVFDLVICDEAHRTVGAEYADESEEERSSFQLIHDNGAVPAKKRLYMTATPRTFNRAAKDKAAQNDIRIYSMDDREKFGRTLYKLKFSEAIDLNLLSDYRVIVMHVDKEHIPETLRDIPAEIKLNDAAKWIGCYRALQDPKIDGSVPSLQKAIAFTNRVKDSERIKENFSNTVENYIDGDEFRCMVDHVDGRQNAGHRRRVLKWLEESAKDDTVCHIVSNARCLSEGVDVPSLDSVIFMERRRSQVEIIQAVGRVLRTAPGKQYGYVIIPVGVSSGVEAHEMLDSSEDYEAVWDVLTALRSHDDRLDTSIAIRAIKQKVEGSAGPAIADDNAGEMTGLVDDHLIMGGIGEDGIVYPEDRTTGTIRVGNSEIPASAIRARLVDKVGRRMYLEAWAKDVATVTGSIKARIAGIITDGAPADEFDGFHESLKAIINDGLTRDDCIDMLSQHMVTARIFNALFDGGRFTEENPVSVSMSKMVNILGGHGLEAELEGLEEFYKSLEERISDISTDAGRQNLMRKLYDDFFKIALEKTAERLGIVYTPVEVVDFILESADHVLKREFGGRGLTGKNINIIDPFAGTGTFLARLMSRDLNLITDEDISRKYKEELHANEIILLAYYIGAVNCEMVYHSRTQEEHDDGEYEPFSGIVFNDTFSSKEIGEWGDEHLLAGPKRQIERQRNSKITVIVGNPPYSAKQEKFAEDNANTKYPHIDSRIAETYAKYSGVKLKTSLRDSYVRALRWASDRIGESGVIAFVTNGSFVKSEAASGIRACFEKEFTDIWCFNLRGNGRITGDGRNIFEYKGQSAGGTRTPIAIIILVKNPKKNKCLIQYKSLESKYYSGQDKRDRVHELKSITGITDWQLITPDKHHDWVDQRDDSFYRYLVMGSDSVKRGSEGHAIFKSYSNGIKTNRDAWIYNTSRKNVEKNMMRHVKYCASQDPKNPDTHTKQAAYTEDLIIRLLKAKTKPQFSKKNIRTALYRPFFKQYMYLDRMFLNSVYRIPSFFPNPDSKNQVICVPYKFTGNFSLFITDVTPDLQIVKNGQCFPLYIYDSNDKRSDNITTKALSEYREHYNDNTITRKDIFHYIYGILHHPEYRAKFASNLTKELPRIPMAPDFGAFRDVGQKLAELHLNYEICPRYNLCRPKARFGIVQKIKFGSRTIKTADGKNKRLADTTKIYLNGVLVFDNIPTISYTVNGRTPIAWFVDRYGMSTDKASGITNLPCEDMSEEDVIACIERLVYVGVESDRIMAEGLPAEFEPKDWKAAKTGLYRF